MPLPCLRLLTAAAILAVMPALAGQSSEQQAPPQPAPQQPAQEAPAPAPSAATPANTITRYARLVVLDAVVLDAKGNPVTDLQQSDFHITEDNEPQAIRDFEAPGRYTPPPAVTIESTADLDRLAPRAPVNIVLLDEFNTHFDDMAFARYSLKNWLEKQPAKLDTPTMLIAVTLEKFTVLRDYTQNKDEILKALDHHFAVDPWQLHGGSWLSERYSTALVSLRRVSEAVIGHPGHKTMIWVGRGFPTLNLSKLAVDDQSRINSAVQQTVDQLRDARVTLYTIDPAGVMVDASKYDEGSPGDYQGSLAPFGGSPDFGAIASATGGRNLYGRNDVDREIGTSIRDGSSFYSFSYRPTNSSTNVMKFRRIKVVVDRPGLTVVTRQGYYPDFSAPRLSKEGVAGKTMTREMFGAATSNMVYDGVSFAVRRSPTDAKSFQFHVDGQGLIWSAGIGKPRSSRLILLITYYDKKGNELKHEGTSMSFDAPPGSPAMGPIDHPLNFKYDVAPASKATRARVVVRVEASGRMGTADLDLSNAAAIAQSAPPVSSAPVPTPQAP